MKTRIYIFNCQFISKYVSLKMCFQILITVKSHEHIDKYMLHELQFHINSYE